MGDNHKVVDENEERYKSRTRVAYLGPPASYTHQAALNTYSDGAQYELIPQTTISDVFAAVETNTADYGVVPFENSTNGCVATTLDLFARGLTLPESSLPSALQKESASAPSPAPKLATTASTERASIEAFGEVYVPVKHCLLGHSPPDSTGCPLRDHTTGPATNADEDVEEMERLLSGVKTIYTHPQAWGQCAHLLSRVEALKRAEKIDVSSTSKAAELAAADASGSCVAIASGVAAHVYNVPSLLEGIQDRSDNVTRFLSLRRTQHPDAEAAIHKLDDRAGSRQPRPRDSSHPADDTGREQKYLIAFTVPSPRFTQPGALARSLGVFERHGLSLSSINSRPSGSVAWHYIFFVEAGFGADEAGNAGVDDDAELRMSRRETRLTRALQELDAHTETCRLLGSFTPSASPS